MPCRNPLDHGPHEYLADADAITLSPCPGGGAVIPKLPESREEFEAIQRRQKEQIETLRLTLARAQQQFDRACNEYSDWARECRKKGYS